MFLKTVKMSTNLFKKCTWAHEEIDSIVRQYSFLYFDENKSNVLSMRQHREITSKCRTPENGISTSYE